MRRFTLFLNHFRDDWLTLMSGGFAVPASVASAFFDGWQQTLTTALALSAFVFAAYRVWLREHERAEDLHGRLVPRISIGDVRVNEGVVANNGTLRDYVQLEVIPLTDQALDDCRGQFGKVYRQADTGGWTSVFDDSCDCEWSYGQSSLRTIRKGERALLNIVWRRRRENSSASALHPAMLGESLQFTEAIKPAGIYRLEIVVTARDAKSVHAAIIVDSRNQNLSIRKE